jgi:G3E family GTPase
LSTPVHLVTGFLGAGKTTLLNRLLRDPALAETLVVVNEFGEAALDHRLYERLDGEIALLASGCLCCTLRGDFAEALRALLKRRAAGELSFRRIVVETSGLADPGPILYALFADATLAIETRLAQVTTLVDAVAGLATLERHGEARRQVALADRLVVTKGAAEAPLRAALARLAPTAAICEASDFDAAQFLDAFPRSAAGLSPRAAHGGGEARTFRSATPIEPARFARFLSVLGEVSGPRLWRVKGLVATADAPGQPWLVQGAQHALAPPLRLAAWPAGPQETSLTAIGEDLAAVERLWAALTGSLAPDAPDWSALTDNPLAPATRRGLLG